MFTLDELLIFAVRGRKPELVRERLAAGANPSYYGAQGAALLVAITSGQLEMIHILMGHGANIHLTDARGYGTLEYALRSGNLDVIDVVLHYGASLKAHRSHWHEALKQHFTISR
jgi:ankyrin repeat protein